MYRPNGNGGDANSQHTPSRMPQIRKAKELEIIARREHFGCYATSFPNLVGRYYHWRSRSDYELELEGGTLVGKGCSPQRAAQLVVVPPRFLAREDASGPAVACQVGKDVHHWAAAFRSFH